MRMYKSQRRVREKLEGRKSYLSADVTNVCRRHVLFRYAVQLLRANGLRALGMASARLMIEAGIPRLGLQPIVLALNCDRGLIVEAWMNDECH